MRSKASILFLCLIWLAGLLSACGLVDSASLPSGEGDVQTSDADGTAAATAETVPGPTSSPVFGTAVPPTPEISELIVWIPPEIARRTESGSAVLEAQIRAFDAKYPSVTIRVEQKVVSGAGGILSYLRTGRGVAPSILPDMIALPTSQVKAAAAELLIYPLDSVIDTNQFDSLFPPMLMAVEMDAQRYGFPFAVDSLPHLIYNTDEVTRTLPLTWNGLVELEDQHMVFAADGRDGALLALQFYLDAGGQVVDESGKPTLQLEPLTSALQMISYGRDTGFLAPESLTLVNYSDIWQVYTSGPAKIARTTPDFFLGQRSEALPTNYTVTPGMDRPSTPLATGWAWALSNSDPAHQALVAELMLDLTSAENMGNWSRESNLLPARRDAFSQWDSDDTYVTFITRELERSVPLPNVAPSILPVLEDAVFDVFSGASTPGTAAASAVEKLQNS